MSEPMSHKDRSSQNEQCLEGRALITLFKPSGKYYTEERWRIPEGAIGPYDMSRSPDFRRISGGPVLVDTQEPWGFPHLFPGLTDPNFVSER